MCAEYRSLVLDPIVYYDNEDGTVENLLPNIPDIARLEYSDGCLQDEGHYLTY